jgi:hypothetical protein
LLGSNDQKNSDDDLEEYRDLVFDFDESKALVKMADDFLQDK